MRAICVWVYKTKNDGVAGADSREWLGGKTKLYSMFVWLQCPINETLFFGTKECNEDLSYETFRNYYILYERRYEMTKDFFLFLCSRARDTVRISYTIIHNPVRFVLLLLYCTTHGINTGSRGTAKTLLYCDMTNSLAHHFRSIVQR